MSANGDGLCPTGNKPGNVLADDWLTEDSAAQNVSDGSVGALPHLFQAKFWWKTKLSEQTSTLNNYRNRVSRAITLHSNHVLCNYVLSPRGTNINFFKVSLTFTIIRHFLFF